MSGPADAAGTVLGVMTRHDFEDVAAAISAARKLYRSNAAHAQAAVAMAHALGAANPRFDHARFVRAAMPREWVGTRHETVWERAAWRVRAAAMAGRCAADSESGR